MPDTLDGRAKSIIDSVIDLSGTDRSEFLDRACSGDAALRRRVDMLLASMEEDDGFLQQPTVRVIPSPSDPASLESPDGRIGPYTLIELIGQGGFGSVYLAEQFQPVRRRVALKIIKLGMDTRQVIARFEAERQALALMDHPNIARVLDAGATESGRPYFVMELVRGEPITAYCDRERLSIRHRLELFRDICGAVQHAHQKGVIHRDIKPSNILVTAVDGRVIPKVIDFGIAKATSARLTDRTLQTEEHQFIGTPEYMSPEQAESSGADIDTRSDVYSLGVLLYELLTANAPFDRERLRSASISELQRIIREEDPPRPSDRLAMRAALSRQSRLQDRAGKATPSPGSSVLEIAQRRRTEPAPLTRTIRGDLDWIVLKCLEKDRDRRYETASALSEDIDRYLTDETVHATPPSAGYRIRKFARRYRVQVVVASTFVALLMASSVIAWALYRSAENARGLALERTAQATGRLWESLLAQARAGRSGMQIGRRFEGLEAIRQAAAIRAAPELRDEAIACLGLADLTLVKTFQNVPSASAMGLMNPDRFAYATEDGRIHVIAVDDGREIRQLDGRPGAFLHLSLHFSSDGEYLVAKYSARNSRFHVDVWDLSAGSRLLARDDSSVDPAQAFSPTSEWVALKESDQLVHFYRLPSGEEFKKLAFGPGLNKLQADPSGRFLAASASQAPYVRVWDVVDDRLVSEFDMPSRAGQLDWSQDGRLLAAGGGDDDWKIYVWDFNSKELMTVSAAHQNTVTLIRFHPQAELMASQGWDHTSRFWDLRARRELVGPLQGWFVHGFGDLFACRGEQSDFAIWRLESAREVRRLWAESPFGYTGGMHLASDSAKLVTATTQGVSIWDLETAGQPVVLSRQRSVWAETISKSGEVLAATTEGLFRFPPSDQDREGRNTKPSLLWRQNGIRGCCVNPADGTVIVSVPPELVVFNPESGQVIRRLPGFPGMNRVSISPDGRWVFVGNWKGASARLMDAASGEVIREFTGESVKGFFSPDGRWLLVANGPDFLLCETGSWTVTRRIQRLYPEAAAGAAAFSSDGTMMALAYSQYVIKLVDLASGEVLATLPNLDQFAVLDLSFTHDDRWLVVTTVERLIEAWDIPRVRDGLRAIGLDW